MCGVPHNHPQDKMLAKHGCPPTEPKIKSASTTEQKIKFASIKKPK
jgi:hypothetical protein